MHDKKIVFIVGPTAVGKSDVAFFLAQKINGEIVSCDSMQVYKEIHIASNKPEKDLLKKVPHHLIGVISVEDDFDVVQFNRMARKVIDEILSRDKTPIVVGGSGLYVNVLLDGIFADSARDEGLRTLLFDQATEHGPEYLYRQLQIKDPQAAEKIHPHNIKRVVRALEVILTKNAPISTLQKKREGLWGNFDIAIFGLDQERAALYEKINARVDQMIAQGLVEEVKKLHNLQLGVTAKYLIGIKEIQGYLKGEWDLPEAVRKMKQNTRHFAKRQLTWFRKDNRIQWNDLKQGQSMASVAETLSQVVTA